MSEEAPEVAPDEVDEVWLHVCRQLEDLGFDPWQATVLANAGASWHEARKLIEKGCPHATAVKLLL